MTVMLIRMPGTCAKKHNDNHVCEREIFDELNLRKKLVIPVKLFNFLIIILLQK